MGSILIIVSKIFFSLWFHHCMFALSRQAYSISDNNLSHTRMMTITVDQSGKGKFSKVQDAINFVPSGNSHWIRIQVRPGTYNEKVIIPAEKPFIVLEGDGRETTIIQWTDGGDSLKSSTFTLQGPNFVAKNITFKNLHDLSGNLTWAPAALILGDKAAFYNCGFISVQDTLTDSQGRHYFESCYIQGGVDFIWGDGQSIYQGCTVNVTYELGRANEVGYITAHARHSADSQTGFVFIDSSVVGTVSDRTTYLGRAYTQYSRVIFYKSQLNSLIASEGWSAWFSAGHEDSIIFAEEGCSGPGANTSDRVRWVKRLGKEELESLVDVNRFINNDGWLNKLPS